MEEKQGGSGRVAFFAALPKFRPEIEAGYFVTVVYRKYQNELGGIGYNQFLNYVNEHIKGKKPGKKKEVEPEKETEIPDRSTETIAKKFKQAPNRKEII